MSMSMSMTSDTLDSIITPLQIHNRPILDSPTSLRLPPWRTIPMARRQPTLRLGDLDPTPQPRLRPGSRICESALYMDGRMSK
jgi:hypothetical protein